MTNKRFFAACGAGGAGKTVTLDAVLKQLSEKGIKAHFEPSIVRGFYAKKGVADQAAFLALPVEERRPFQIELYKYYLSHMADVVNTRDEIVLSDRSPFDHLAFTTQGVSDITLAEFAELRKMANDFADTYINTVFFFPYPTPFSKDKDPDNFRVAHPSQNIMIDALMYRLSNPGLVDYERVIVHAMLLGEPISIERRASFIVNHIVEAMSTRNSL